VCSLYTFAVCIIHVEILTRLNMCVFNLDWIVLSGKITYESSGFGVIFTNHKPFISVFNVVLCILSLFLCLTWPNHCKALHCLLYQSSVFSIILYHFLYGPFISMFKIALCVLFWPFSEHIV
jgi:hypothetical protein